MPPKSPDVLVIGAGHNGLTCACYLARAGLTVTLLERRDVVGGAAVTEEFHPGFRNSLASYTVSLLHPDVIRDLRLAEHGLRIVERPMLNFAPQPDGGHLCIGNTREETLRSLARHSARDVERLPQYGEMLERVASVLRELVLVAPPNAGGGVLEELPKLLRLSRTWRALSPPAQRDAWELFTRSAGEMLDWWFESDALKGVYGFDSVVGNYASPYTPGSAYVLLHHCFGEVNGRKGVWGHAIGGMGSITQAMQREAERLGVTVLREAEVRRIVVERGATAGVELADGRRLGARAVVAGVDPRRLYLSLVDAADLDPEFRSRIERWRCGSATLRMNVALAELPRFTALPEPGPHLGAGIIMAPSLGYLERAYLDARREGLSREPIVEMVIPSVLDDSLAPPGAHVASLFCQHFAPALPDGRSWDDSADAAADLVIDSVTRYAPNFRASILGRMVLTPLELERKLGLTGGDIFHGALTLDQLFSARPSLGHAAYRGPLRGLYMCGSGTHPGGGVSGLPGRNAARTILRDLGRKAT
ncbi:MAG: NAD(P)/FAD-dependent oxidoreductase [Steroidobacteraceae bacterium]|jgi:phytoene dehydrogenase-like protein|nr:NAD(P)/FAD-dependent oxidoreductase [Steroidobacteraceae bacterium]